MKGTVWAAAVATATTLVVGPTLGQEPESELRADRSQIETFGRYSGKWGYEWTAATRALNSEGIASVVLPPSARRHVERKRTAFERLFGSATEHGLEHGTVAPRSFCPPEPSGQWGYRLADHLGSVLLLSEVAVEATVIGTTIGLSPSGSPSVLLELADVRPLTSRSPSPQFAVVSLGQLVIGDHVFCGERGPLATGDSLLPQVGSRLILIGAWRHGAVFFGELHDSWYAELKGDELRWSYGGYGVESLDEIAARIDELERGGLFDQTAELVDPEADPMGRSRFARRWAELVEDDCRPMSVWSDDDGQRLPACEIDH